MTTDVVDFSIIGGTAARRPGPGLRPAVEDGTIPIGVGSALTAAFAPPVVATLVTDESAGRWWFVGLGLAGIVLMISGVLLRRWTRLRTSVGVVVAISDAVGESDRLKQDFAAAERQLDRDCTLALAVTGTIPGQEPEAVVATIDRAASRTVQALSMAERVGAFAPSAWVVPMMRLHMAFRFGAQLGHTFPRALVLMDKRQDAGAASYFPAVQLRAGNAAGSMLTVTYKNVEKGDPDRAALAVDLQGFREDFLGLVLAACDVYGYGQLMLLSSGSVRLDTGADLAYQSIVDEICEAWRIGRVSDLARTKERGIFLTGPPSVAVALGARLRATRGLWTPYQFVSRAPGEGRYVPLVEPSRAER